MKRFIQTIVILGICAFSFSSCTEYTPKPKGYFRIDLPQQKHYAKFEEPHYPFSFEYSDMAKVIPPSKKNEENSFWVDIAYPSINARIYCSYKPIKGNFQEIAEDSRTFVYKHTVKADGITEQPYENSDRHVYGILYELKGNTASNYQFILTDSTEHFFRGALYFNSSPNKDSIAPVAKFIKEDIIKMIETFEWEKQQK
ncbi:MAG: gliding motility lipoprotein GldD [Paludibacteraceae bacterium]|nr:gliding motility lipoprotein GldD [Prevotellaceae bacterium]